MNFLLVCVAGGIGTGARHLISIWSQRYGAALPFGTVIVNLVGCFAIAGLMHAAQTLGWSPTTRATVTVGLLGGFTTYSSFNYETMRLFEEGAVGTATANVALTLLGGFAAGWLGLLAARELLGR